MASSGYDFWFVWHRLTQRASRISLRLPLCAAQAISLIRVQRRESSITTRVEIDGWVCRRRRRRRECRGGSWRWSSRRLLLRCIQTCNSRHSLALWRSHLDARVQLVLLVSSFRLVLCRTVEGIGVTCVGGGRAGSVWLRLLLRRLSHPLNALVLLGDGTLDDHQCDRQQEEQYEEAHKRYDQPEPPTLSYFRRHTREPLSEVGNPRVQCTVRV